MTFVATIKFTQQGIANIQDTCKRADNLKAAARKLGAKVTDVLWTLGPFDGLILFDAPDEETATAVMLHLGRLGNLQTQTARAYRAAEMKAILDKLPA